MNELQQWLESGEYMPEFMRDFHDQKDVFKSLQILYNEDSATPDELSWIDCHIYVVDRFLWYMASRGYTLQKSRKRVEFREMIDHHSFVRQNIPSLSLTQS